MKKYKVLVMVIMFMAIMQFPGPAAVEASVPMDQIKNGLNTKMWG